MCLYWLEQGNVGPCSYSGQPNVACTRRDCIAIQPDYQVSYIAALTLCDYLGIRRREWIGGRLDVVVDVRYWIYKYRLSLRKRKDDSVILTTENGGLLPVYNPRRFVPVFCEYDLHVLMWKYGLAVDCRSTRYGT